MIKNILIIDDDKNIQKTLKIYFESKKFDVFTALTGQDGIELNNKYHPEIVLLDLKLPDMSGISIIGKLKLTTEEFPYIILITAFATIDTAVQAIKLGAFDYLPKPFTPEQLNHVVEKIKKFHTLQEETKELKDRLKGIERTGEFIVKNEEMKKIVNNAKKLAESDITLLITGETGTGKEMLARNIHNWSLRKEKPFITLDCTTLHENLLESELFGHVKGAFTGAIKDYTGKLETANGGTLFIDEISELPLSLQSKFLHFLQHKEFERVGDNKPISIDVRILAASNRNLESLVEDNIFRSDLYFRISVAEIYLPPLRARSEDIIPLAEYFLNYYRKLHKKSIRGFDKKIINVLLDYKWPGNIRELENTIERAVILCEKEEINIECFPNKVFEDKKISDNITIDPQYSLEELEKIYIEKVLHNTKTIEEAARILGIDPTTLWRKRKKYNI